MTVWAIWKSKLKISINNLDVTPNETTQQLKELITDLIGKAGTLHDSWKKAGKQLGYERSEDCGWMNV